MSKLTRPANLMLCMSLPLSEHDCLLRAFGSAPNMAAVAKRLLLSEADYLGYPLKTEDTMPIKCQFLSEKHRQQIENMTRGIIKRTSRELIDYLRARPGMCGAVALQNATVAGFVVYKVARNHYEIHELFVAAQYRRRRVATQIIDWLKGKLDCGKRKLLITRTDEPTEQTKGWHLCLRFNGFRATGYAKASDGADRQVEFAFRKEGK